MLIYGSSKVKDVLESAFSVDEMYWTKIMFPHVARKVKDGTEIPFAFIYHLSF